MFTVGHRPGNNDVSQGWGKKKKIFVGSIHFILARIKMSVYRLHGTQNDWVELTVSTQNWF